MKLFRVLRAALGCRHGRLSRVLTIKEADVPSLLRVWAGHEYSWALMQPERNVANRASMSFCAESGLQVSVL
jgi:hypothetical protein